MEYKYYGLLYDYLLLIKPLVVTLMDVFSPLNFPFVCGSSQDFKMETMNVLHRMSRHHQEETTILW